MKRSARKKLCDGRDLWGMFASGARWLEREAEAVNALNVFPVPDGDTGTNMILTLKATLGPFDKLLRQAQDGVRAPQAPSTSSGVVLQPKDVALSPSKGRRQDAVGSHAGDAAQAMAQGALLGARGNSGVILYLIFRGLAQGLAGKSRFGGEDMAVALGEASAVAYHGVTQPVEGTILTVIRDASEAARGACSPDVIATLKAAVRAAQESVDRTPALLPVLRQAGVVDAGGLGLALLLEGSLRYLEGDETPVPPLARKYPRAVQPSTLRQAQGTAGSFDELRMASGHRPAAEERSFGYCTEFLIQGEGLDGEQVKQKLSSLGESVLVVGDQSTLRVHLHSLDPGATLSYATSLGSLRRVKVEDMEEQHRHLLALPTQEGQALQEAPSGGIWPVAVASGEGLAEVFRSLGAKAIVSGGQTMNPSVQELLEAVEAAPASQVIILPNNSNIIPAAQQVQTLTAKEVAVIPTRSIPQGVAALLAFNPEAALQANAAAMERASAAVRTGEVTTAVRSMKWDGLSVKRGQAIGLLEGKLVEAGASRPAVALSLLSRMGLGEGKMVTLYCGAEADPGEVEEVLRALKERFPGLEAEAVAGGQPHYHYILSVE